MCLGLSTQAFALPCSLTESDYQALAKTTEKSYTKSDIEALEPRDQEALCKARKFYREARGKDPRVFARTHTLNDIPVRMSRFFDCRGIWPSAFSDERGNCGGLC